MNTFKINVLIQFLVSSICFEHPVLVIRKTICIYSFYGKFVMQLCKQSIRSNIVLDVSKNQSYYSPEFPRGFRKSRFPYYVTMAQKGGKVVSLTHRPSLPAGNVSGTHFC